MRETTSWRNKLTRQLRACWSKTATPLNPGTLCEVELGLYVLSQLTPEAPADALWVLLSGYPFPAPEMQGWSQVQQRMLFNARHLLTNFRGPYRWRRTLEQYRALDERLRGYDIDEKYQQFKERAVSVCPERLDIYAKVLQELLPYRTDSLRWATAGSYSFADRAYRASVNIPDNLVFPPPTGHNLSGKQERAALSVAWDDLLATARWMDSETQARGLADAHWEKRLSRVRLELLNRENGTLNQANTLTLDGLEHLIGMVSSGKSTLMDVLAVWAARKGLHVTLVVGDVIGALNRAQQFSNLGISVAPILGASNRERHINRLHRVLTAEQPLAALQPEHAGFQWLSTACPLDGLRETERPCQIGAHPCLTLSRLGESEKTEEPATATSPKQYACPLYSVCPSHQGQRDLVTASIWIATPASLVYSRVAPQLNSEQVRFAELVYRRSDLVIVDEADQVQVQLDTIFSPSQTLVSRRGDAWLSRLWQQVVTQLNQEGRGQLVDESVASWCKAHNNLQGVTSQIYERLRREPALRGWIEQRDYFTDWILLERIAVTLSGASSHDDPVYNRLMKSFEDYIDAPVQGPEEHLLSDLTRRLITDTDESLVRDRLKAWLLENKKPTVVLSDEQLAELAGRLEFALLVAVLQNRLNLLIRDWRLVETPLQLEGGSSILLHRPPRDYEAVIPVAPMGNVLAFQYVGSLENTNDAGDLRFFRCMGVGRWLLLHLHELFDGDRRLGPHVLLLSGTSWAGKAPGFHIQVPVSGVLRSPDTEVEAIAESQFRFFPIYDNNQKPISVSGTNGSQRIAALKDILYQLARRSGLSRISLLEKERDSLPASRQRLLLLVGSYEEARLAHEALENLRPDWQGQIRHLVPDDDEFESQWRGSEQSLQRGLVHQFANTGAWILIAPLLAVERGHNILNEDDEAAIGAAYFLVRPHPRPDDINYAIHSINRWAVERCSDAAALAQECQEEQLTLERVGTAFRQAAYHRWRSLLHMPMIYSTLPQSERDAVTWTQLVTIWQVIGRLVRGGSPARVFFCDAAFARHTVTQDERGDSPSTSLLVGMKQVLRPYFTPDSNPCIPVSDQQLVQALYGPFYQALERMGGVADATTI